MRFERISNEWGKIRPHGGWGQLALHSHELGGHFMIGGLQLRRDEVAFENARGVIVRRK